LYPGYELFAQVSYLRGDFEEAKGLLDAVCSCCDAGREPSCCCQSTTWLIRARILVAKGKYNQARDILDRLVCDDDAPLLPCEKLQIEAEIAIDLGCYDEAVETLVQVIEAKEHELGEDHPDLCRALLSLARAQQLRGDREKSVICLCDRVVDILTALHRGPPPLPVVHPQVGKSRWLKGIHYFYSEGKYARSAPISEDGHRILQSALLDTHPDRAASLDHLARVRWANCEFEEADRLADTAFSDLSRGLPSVHYLLAESHATKGWIFHSQGCFHSAEHQFKCAERIWKCIEEKYLGDGHSGKVEATDKHPGKADPLIGRAVTYIGQGEDEKDIESLLNRAERLLKQRLGKAHTAFEWYRRARLLDVHGRYAEAAELYRRAHALYKPFATTEALKKQYLLPIKNRACDWEEQACVLDQHECWAEATLLYVCAYRVYEVSANSNELDEYLLAITKRAHEWCLRARELMEQGYFSEAKLLYQCAYRIYELYAKTDKQKEEYLDPILKRLEAIEQGK
jgi:tetratricopeptide (TPR) repeat protein